MKKTNIVLLLILSSCMSSCSFFNVMNNAINSQIENNPNIESRDRSKESYINNNFTETESSLLNTYFGFTVSYLENDSYDLLDYTNDVSVFYYDMKKNDFNNYEDTLKSNYTYLSDNKNNYGYDCLTYQVDSNYIDLCYIENEEIIYLNVYNKDFYNFKRESKNSEGVILQNVYKNLPNYSESTLKLDFNSKYILANDARDLGQFKESCNSIGSPYVLVIPVEFKDAKASDKGYTIEAIKNAFYKNEETKATLDFYSLYDYFYESSFGKLDLNIEVLDNWFMPQYDSTYYKNATFKVNDHVLKNGEQIIMNEALEYLDSIGYDLSKYDVDGNERIDSIVMINTLDIINPTDMNDSFNWAFRYYNYYLANKTDYYTYDGVAANDYVWANYKFLYLDDYDEYNRKTPTNTYTFIHEFSHILGAEDYYNYYGYRTKDGPLKGLDLMDETPTDHCPFTKMNYGWLDNVYLILDTGKYKLDSIEKNNGCYILGSDFDLSLGIYQEYYLICYYTNEGINEKYNMFEEPTIAIYHIDASLLRLSNTYVGLLNDNDAYASGGSKNNLISLAGTYGLSKIRFRLVNNFRLITNNNERIPFTLNFEYCKDGMYLIVK